MMQQEFEQIAGYEVSFKDYEEIIQPMYMALNLSKQEFVKCLSEKRFSLNYKRSQLLKEIRKIAAFLHDNCGRSCFYEEEDQLDKLIAEYANITYFDRFPCEKNNAGFTRKNAWLWYEKGYECEKYQTGCTYPKEVTIMDGDNVVDVITLVKAKKAA